MDDKKNPKTLYINGEFGFFFLVGMQFSKIQKLLSKNLKGIYDK